MLLIQKLSFQSPQTSNTEVSSKEDTYLNMFYLYPCDNIYSSLPGNSNYEDIKLLLLDHELQMKEN